MINHLMHLHDLSHQAFHLINFYTKKIIFNDFSNLVIKNKKFEIRKV